VDAIQGEQNFTDLGIDKDKAPHGMTTVDNLYLIGQIKRAARAFEQSRLQEV
jgi:hypothetical protein